MHPKQLMDVLTSFGSENILKFKSEFNFSEFGVNLKLSLLRLSDTTIIISKTKPVIEYGSSTQYLSIALLSLEFIKDAGSNFLIAPLISYEIRNKKIMKCLTPNPESYLGLILKYSFGLFTNTDQLLSYALNLQIDNGTNFIMTQIKKQ